MLTPVAWFMPAPAFCLRSTTSARFCLQPPRRSGRRGKPRFDDDEETFAKRNRHRASLPAPDALDSVDGLPEGDRWSTWDQSTAGERGPVPYPRWLVTDLAAADSELGILKTGKEADVFLVRRGVPGSDRSCLLAAKRYRAAEHKMFHRDGEITWRSGGSEIS